MFYFSGGWWEGVHLSYPNVFHTLVQVTAAICVEESSYYKQDHDDIHQQPENQERPHHSTVNKRKSGIMDCCPGSSLGPCRLGLVCHAVPKFCSFLTAESFQFEGMGQIFCFVEFFILLFNRIVSNTYF